MESSRWEERLTFVATDYLEFQVEPVDLIVTYSTLQNIPASAEQLFVKIAADLKNHETCYIIAGVKKKKIIMDKIIPLKSLTGLLKLPEAGLLRLDFLLTEEADGVYIRCLDFGIMSRGNTVNECQENIIEAMMIYLEDLPDGQSLFNPAPPQYWQMFYELRYHQERTIVKPLSHQAKQAIVNLPVVFQYA